MAERLRRVHLRQQPADQTRWPARHDNDVPFLGVVDSPWQHLFHRPVIGQLGGDSRVGATRRLVDQPGALRSRGTQNRPHAWFEVVLGRHRPSLARRRARQQLWRIRRHLLILSRSRTPAVHGWRRRQDWRIRVRNGISAGTRCPTGHAARSVLALVEARNITCFPAKPRSPGRRMRPRRRPSSALQVGQPRWWS